MRFRYFSPQNITKVLLMVIVFAGWILRIQNQDKWIWEMTGYDESRDMLVARHIVEYGEVIRRGPLAAGSRNVLMNSSVYYYVIAFLWFLGRSPKAVMMLWSILSTLPILIGYCIGSRLFSAGAGLFVAFVIAIHPEMVYTSRFISQPKLIPALILLIVYLLITIKRYSYITFTLCMGLVFFPLFIHYSYLSIIPLFIFWLSYQWYIQERTQPLVFFVSIVALVEAYGFIWLMSTSPGVFLGQQFFFREQVIFNPSVYSANIIHIVKIIFSILFPNVLDAAVWILFIGGISGFLFFRKQRSRFKNIRILLCITTFISVTLTGLYKGHIGPHYVYGPFTLLFLVFVLGVWNIVHRRRMLQVLAVLLCAYIFLPTTITRSAPAIHTPVYKQFRDIARAIFDDYRGSYVSQKSAEALQGQLPLFVLATYSTTPHLVYDGWGNASSWFWLEYMFSRQLVRLTDYGVNFAYTVRNPRYFYVICDHRNDTHNAYICMNRFVRKRDYVSTDYKITYSSPDFTVWRYDIVSQVRIDDFNTVNNDLL